MADLFGEEPPQPRPRARRREISTPPATSIAKNVEHGSAAARNASMGLRSGTCVGGPYDGKQLHHHSDTRWIAWRRGEEDRGPITYAGPETDEIYYAQYLFRDGQWHYSDGKENEDGA